MFQELETHREDRNKETSEKIKKKCTNSILAISSKNGKQLRENTNTPSEERGIWFDIRFCSPSMNKVRNVWQRLRLIGRNVVSEDETWRKATPVRARNGWNSSVLHPRLLHDRIPSLSTLLCFQPTSPSSHPLHTGDRMKGFTSETLRFPRVAPFLTPFRQYDKDMTLERK